MATTPITSSAANSAAKSAVATGTQNALQHFSIDDFLKLMITQLQNQDPLNPTDNDQLLNQLGQLQSISSQTKLSDTLQAVSLNESLASASNLISRQISGLDDAGKKISGVVDRVTVTDGVPKLVVGKSTVSLSNVSEIDAPSAKS